MTWAFLAIIDAEHDDPALYPTLSQADESLPIALEAADGSGPTMIPATSLSIVEVGETGPAKELRRLEDLKLTLMITDSRLVMYCDKFDKGGGWTGFGAAGFAVALAANAVSRARAASRRRGKLLVGQVRYAWLAQVDASPKRNWQTKQLLRMMVLIEEAPDRALVLTFTLPKHNDAAEICAAISRRAGAWALDHQKLSERQRASAEQLISAGPLRPEGAYNGINQPFVGHSMPQPSIPGAAAHMSI